MWRISKPNHTTMTEPSRYYAPKPLTVNLTELDILRFWHKVDKHGPVMRPELDCCWVWTAALNPGGYGRYSFEKETFQAHRISWLIHFGKYDGPLRVLHHCDNPKCVRPSHLHLGTSQENILEMVARNRHVPRPGELHHAFLKPGCMAKGEDAALSKLTDDAVRDIRTMWAAGHSRIKIAQKHKVTVSNIFYITSGRTWKHLL